jgi:hypothetical protein
MKQLLLQITLLLASFSHSDILAQSFYLADGGKVMRTGFDEETDDWVDLNKSEAREYLTKRGFGHIKETFASGQDIVQGTKSFHGSSVPRLLRVLKFKDNVITGSGDVIEFLLPCLACVVKPMKFLSPDLYRESEDDDRKVKSTFLKEYKLSLHRDKIPVELRGDSDHNGFSYSSRVEKSDRIIKRNCSLKVTEYKGSMEFTSSRMVFLLDGEYHVGEYDLKSVNQYDLSLMVKVFLEDCNIHGLRFPEDEVIVSFKGLDGSNIGLSYGMNDESRIELAIDPEKWSEASAPKRWYIVYHELGHDVLNLEHGVGGKMMFNFADRGYSWDEFWEDKEYMLKSVTQ